MFLIRYIKYLAQDYQRCFMLLMIGWSVFFVGLALFYMSADYQLQHELLGELLTLLSLALLGTGVAVAALGYISLLYFRWSALSRRNKKT